MRAEAEEWPRVPIHPANRKGRQIRTLAQLREASKSWSRGREWAGLLTESWQREAHWRHKGPIDVAYKAASVKTEDWQQGMITWRPENQPQGHELAQILANPDLQEQAWSKADASETAVNALSSADLERKIRRCTGLRASEDPLVQHAMQLRDARERQQ